MQLKNAQVSETLVKTLDTIRNYFNEAGWSPEPSLEEVMKLLEEPLALYVLITEQPQPIDVVNGVNSLRKLREELITQLS